MRKYLLGLLVVAALAGCQSSMPDTSRLTDAEFDAINGASCNQLEFMAANNTGQFREFAQWRIDQVC